MSTPHIAAEKGEIAERILLPGDPLRARRIATTLLDDVVEITRVRNMLGYTGRYRGRAVSVMGTGMGIPSLAIYATELIREYGARRLVRIGTCGAVARDARLGDVVLAMGACTDSRYNRLHFGDHDFAATASWALLRGAAEAAARHGVAARIGNVHSTDCFHAPDPRQLALLEAHGVLAVEMEAAGLYGIAARHGVDALAALSVSDLLHGDAHLDAAQRQASLDRVAAWILDALHETPIGAAP